MFRRMLSTSRSRRRFLWISGGTVAAGLTGALCYRGRQDVVRLGLIGCGYRGKQLAKSLWKTWPYPRRAEVVALCDVHAGRTEELREERWPDARTYQYHEDLLASDDLDGVVIATPEHWHTRMAMDALNAGLPVYLEKPMTLTVDEGRQLVEAVRTTGLPIQVGTQQRSSRRFQLACELVRNGRLGRVRSVAVTLPLNLAGGPFPPQTPPAELDWERWVGQAPRADYTRTRFVNFRGYLEYSGGAVTEWGAHHLDIVQWALDVPGPLSVTGEGNPPEVENGFTVYTDYQLTMRYPDDITVTVEPDRTGTAIVFEGDEGRIRVNRQRLTGRPVEELGWTLPDDWIGFGRRDLWGSGEMVHLRDFLECVRTGATPVSDVESQHRTTIACHIGNIAIRLGRTLNWDTAAERLIDDAEADAYLSRTQRAPYETTPASDSGESPRTPDRIALPRRDDRRAA